MAETNSIAMPPRVKDLTGHPPFGRLTVLAFAGQKARKAYWLCRCDCGNETAVRGTELVSGRTQSCGCLGRERTITRNTTHGMSRTLEYRTWNGMIQRCHNPHNKSYHRYGGRSITVCERWRTSLDTFIEDMGPRPTPKHTIERINNSLGYSPDNCKWATRKEQAHNTRQNVMIRFHGKTQCIGAWAEERGMAMKILWQRLNRGWSIERALTTPIR